MRAMSIPRRRDLRLLASAAGISALGDFMAIFPLILAAFIAIIVAVLYRRYGKKMHLPGGGKNLWFLVIVIVVLLMWSVHTGH